MHTPGTHPGPQGPNRGAKNRTTRPGRGSSRNGSFASRGNGGRDARARSQGAVGGGDEKVAGGGKTASGKAENGGGRGQQGGFDARAEIKRELQELKAERARLRAEKGAAGPGSKKSK